MPDPKSQIRSPNSRRRGGTYIIVVGSALIVSTLGMMAILEQRIQRRGFEAAARMEQARLNIESALRLGLLDVERDPDWRNTYAARGGEVLSASSAEFGDVVLTATDPYDGSLTDDASDPVVLRATATAGPATQYGELMLHPAAVPPEVLWKGIVAGDDVTSNGGTIRCEMPISCDAASLTSANLYADVEAVSISGGTYHGGQTLVLDADRPPLPHIDAVISEYVSRGTAISMSNLPTSTPNLIRNPGMEDGAGGSGEEDGDGLPAKYWFSTPTPPESETCVVEQESEQKRSGNFSLYVRNRTGHSAGPIQYTTEWVKPNATYRVRAWLKPKELLSTTDFRFSWYSNGTATAEQWQVAGLLSLDPLLNSLSEWYELSTTIHAGSWAGDLELSYIKIESSALLSAPDFYVDNFTIEEINNRFLYRQVLSPNSNPFGSTNPEGIYVIDCAGAPLVIERSRIVGTLVILNPGAGSKITGPMSWEPARPGYPALLVGKSGSYNANMNISTNGQGLSEALNSTWFIDRREPTNYNPSGTPHDAVGEDSDEKDILPSEIRGWIYVGGTLTFGNRPTVRGVVMAGDDVVLNGNPHVYWDPAALHHGPPGLEPTLKLKPRPGASKRAVQ